MDTPGAGRRGHAGEPGIGGVGDWAVVIDAPAWAWRLGLATIGLTAYVGNPPHPGPGLALPASRGWLLAAAATAFVFVVVLGPSVRF